MRNSVVLALTLVACGGASSKSTVGEPARLPAASTHCYVGSGETTLVESGKVVDTFDTVAKRSLDPAAATIREEVAVGGGQPGRYNVTMKVEGAKVTVKEDSGVFTGDGDLVGAPWEWSSWTTRSTMGGMTVTSVDTLTGDKLETKKTIEQGGKVVVTQVEHFTTMPCGQFDAKASEIAKQ